MRDGDRSTEMAFPPTRAMKNARERCAEARQRREHECIQGEQLNDCCCCSALAHVFLPVCRSPSVHHLFHRCNFFSRSFVPIMQKFLRESY